MTDDQRAQLETLAVWHTRQACTAARVARCQCPHGGREQSEEAARHHEDAARLLRQLTNGT